MSLIILSNPTTRFFLFLRSWERCWLYVMSRREVSHRDPPEPWVSPHTGCAFSCGQSNGQTQALGQGMTPHLKVHGAGDSHYKSEFGHLHPPQRKLSCNSKKQLLSWSLCPGTAGLGHWAPAGAWESLPVLVRSRPPLSALPCLFARLFVHPPSRHSLGTHNALGTVLSPGNTSGGRTQPCTSNITASAGARQQAKQNHRKLC